MARQPPDRHRRPHPPGLDAPCRGESPDGGRGGDFPGIDRLIARRAGRQHGLVTRRELLAVGVGAGAIDHRVVTGRLHVVHRGVYAVRHRSATVILCLLPDRGGPVHVTRIGSHRCGPVGVVVHETQELEIVHRDGAPVTSPARTLLDLAATGPEHELERALEQAQITRLVTRAELEAVLTPRRPGAARLRRALEAEPTLTRSEAERRFVSLVTRAGLPRPRTNVRVGRHEVDVLWAERRLVVARRSR